MAYLVMGRRGLQARDRDDPSVKSGRGTTLATLRSPGPASRAELIDGLANQGTKGLVGLDLCTLVSGVGRLAGQRQARLEERQIRLQRT